MTDYKAPSIISLVVVLGTMLVVCLDAFIVTTPSRVNYEFLQWLNVTVVAGSGSYIGGRELIQRWRKQ